jgi:ABC-type antimicrobial peptide transport system permease subunit
MTIMGVVGGILGFVLGLPMGLAAAYLVYLRFFAPRRRLQVTTPPIHPCIPFASPPEIKLENRNNHLRMLRFGSSD